MNVQLQSPISKLGKRRQVVIPREIASELNLHEGDYVEVSEKKGTIVLTPKKLVDAEDVLTPEEENRVAKGFAQLKRGEQVPWQPLKRALDL